MKIDRYFVRDVARDAGSRSVVRAIVDVCGALGHSVVAEGVEDAATHEAVDRAGRGRGAGLPVRVRVHRPVELRRVSVALRLYVSARKPGLAGARR